MDIRYIVQEGILSPRDNAYVYRDVAEFVNERAEARHGVDLSGGPRFRVHHHA